MISLKPKSSRATLICALVLALLVVAFLLRLNHLLARIFHVDEYISMLAAQMTALKGVPVLPSGMLYDQGLLTSYLAVPFIWLKSGLSEEMMRWPSLLAGMLTVAGFYLVGRRLFFSRAAGLFALVFAALDMPMILWSARMRMYALAGLFVLLALYFVAQGIVLTPRPAYRLAAVGCFLGAVLSHSVVVVALPAWALAVLIVVAIGYRRFRLNWFASKRAAIELVGLAIVLVLVTAFGLTVVGQVAVSQPDQPGDGAGGISGFFGQFLDIGVSWQRVDDYVYYFASAAYWPLAALNGLALVAALVAVGRRRGTRRDLVTLLLGLICVLTIAELSLALVSTWRKTRYLFVLCQPAFLLLAADGLARLGHLLSLAWRRRSSSLAAIGPVLGVALIVAGWGRPAFDILDARSTGDYDTAFGWVKQRWQEGDQVMTVHPSAAYLYLGHSEYYVSEKRARVLLEEESDEMVDRYVGSTLIDSVDALNQTFASARGRLWLVVDVDRLFNRYNPLFTQQIFAQMEMVNNSGGVPVFLSRPYPRPLPAQPPARLSADFGNLMELGGYSVDFAAIAPDGTLQLALYWRPLTAQIPKPFKVFVQIRNEQQQIVAQADHFIMQGLLTSTVFVQLVEQREWLRDSAALKMPATLPGGNYRLLVGLYDPDTLERVPLVADTSGENAVILEQLTIHESLANVSGYLGWPMVLFLLALVPRVAGLRLFLTTDEPFFASRLADVVTGLMHGDLRATNWNFYPGLTIMWLDGLGVFVQWGIARLTGAVAEAFGQFVRHDVLELMVAIRVPYALLSALFVVAVYLLVGRLVDRRVALVGALLVAWDPFFLAHSRVPHGDGPTAVFMALSVLTFLVHLQTPTVNRRWMDRWLVLSALSGGLAALSKWPGPFMLPFILLLGLGDWLYHDRQAGKRQLIQLASWCALAGLIFVVLWPALWVDPVGTLRQMFDELFGRVEAGHLVFFMGQPTLDPGPWFYPYVIPFRLTPVAWVGLVASAAMSLWAWLGGARRADGGRWRIAAIFWLFTVSLLLFGELSPKKQDRYLLPLFPFLDLLAAFGIVWLVTGITSIMSRRVHDSGVAVYVALAALVALHGYPVLTAYPYYLAYFNPLMGGLPRAVETTLVGWGEGMEQAAAYLDQQPDAARLFVASVPSQTLLPYFRGTGENFYTNDVALRADKVVLYIAQVQRLAPSPEIVRYFQAMAPEHVVSVLGVPYAWVYPGPKVIVSSLPAGVRPVNIGLDGQLRLAGYQVSRQDGVMAVTLYWHAPAVPDKDYTVSVRLVGADGHWLAQQDGWPVEGLLPTHQLRPGDYVRDVHTLQPAAGEDVATVQVVMYDAASGQPLGGPIDLAIER